MDRHVGLAAAIDYIQHPKQSPNHGNNPKNSEISPETLDKLRSVWLQLSFEELDTEFDKQFPLAIIVTIIGTRVFSSHFYVMFSGF